MLFIVQFEDVFADYPARLPERAEHMAAHLAFLAEHSDRVIAAGALRPTDEGMPVGGIWIINAESKATVEAFYKDDPFWKAGLQVRSSEPLGKGVLVADVHSVHGFSWCGIDAGRSTSLGAVC